MQLNDLTAGFSAENEVGSELMQTPKLRLCKLNWGESNFLGGIKSISIYHFYANYVKPISSIRLSLLFLWRVIYPVYTHVVLFVFTHREKRWRPLVKLSDYVAASNVTSIKVFDCMRVDIVKPKVYPLEDQHYLDSPSDHYIFPEVFVAEVNNALIYGGTNLVFMDSEIICHDLYNFQADYTSEELHCRHLIDAKKMRMRLLHIDKMPKEIAVAASFVDACASNYAHWLTEVLSRIAVFCTLKQFEGIPILIDDGLHPNIMESLSLIVGPDRDVIPVPIGRSIKVDKLYVTSVTGYVPFGWRSTKLDNHSHGVFCPLALQVIRNRCFSYVDNSMQKECPSQLYLLRNSEVRGITNSMEIRQTMQKNGYVTVAPENLSFLQQVRLLSNAVDVVSATGAAISSAIFSRPGTKLCILMAKHEMMIYQYWLNMLCPLDIDITYILGVIPEKSKANMHSNFYIDLKSLANIFNDKN